MKLTQWFRKLFSTPDDVEIKLQLRFPFVVFGILLLAAFVLPDRIWNTLLIGLGGMFVVAYMWVWLLAYHLVGQRQMQSGWVAVGDWLEEQFFIQNDSFVPALWIEVEDESNVPDYSSAVVRSVDGNGKTQWRYSAMCMQRGAYRLGPWSLRTGDPFGIFSMRRSFDQMEEIIIHPPIDTQIDIRLPAGQSNGRIRSAQRSWKATINSATVREYRPRDPVRWVHWPTSARRDDLFVREFDLDASGDIWIFLDLQADIQLGDGMEGTEEHAVLLAASLAVQGLYDLRNVGLAAYGVKPQLIAAGQGKGQQWRILRALALTKANGETEIGVALADLSKIAKRGSAVVVITANGDLDWLPALVQLGQSGIDSTVVLLERESFGGQGNTAVLQDAIRHLDFACYRIPKGALGNPLLARAEKPKSYRISPLGKVVDIAPSLASN